MRRFSGDYIGKFNEEVTKLVADKIQNRDERMAAIDDLINEYIEDTGELPDSTQLERLTDAILMEELSDTHPDKITRNEYPFMSDYQLARRQYGAHREKTSNGRIEVPLEYAMSVATDGRDYRYPVRRKRTIDELIYIDEEARSRNEERNKAYRDFTRGHIVDGKRVYSSGVFTIDIASSEKTIHNTEKYRELVPWSDD